MARKIIHDVVTDGNTSVKSKLLDKAETTPHFLSRKKNLSQAKHVKRRRSQMKWLWVIVVILIITGLFFFSTSVLSSAIVEVKPLTSPVSVDGTFTVLLDGDGDVEPSFKVIELRKDAETSVIATGTKNVEHKAEGTIVVFNEEKSSVRLIKNTRFESPNGNIYRVLTPITIPAAKTQNGELVPGSIEIEVVADKPGDQYNIDLVDFTVPGLKGTSKFDTVYARSKTRIAGGYEGKVFQVSDEERDVAEGELEATLERNLLEALRDEVPAGFMLLSDATTIDLDSPVEDLPNGELLEDNQEVKFKQSGIVYGVILDTSEFASAIADRYLEDYEDEPIEISNTHELIFDVLDTSNFTPNESTSLSVDVTGSAILEWKYNEASLKNSLLGTSKKNFQSIVDQYSSTIKSAEATVRPPWSRKFPSDPEKIRIETIIEVF